ncbi:MULTISPECIES: DNA polymerase III subunit delta [unclassified Corynebacterium]|uniref:DNA polymerase III subunit delta n=1 Tax=unclassified Corynebacterium TaxID=2624378 RepID=UPI0021694982|nr:MULTISPECIES: DNA polymerase III subunit delta [unclassified Corynebacterium]MCS4490521.1 DNA polymerase III subunit delta [Corynebacterium sp. ES2775-CONJ]MCS4532508.1 DNA polymerase III subunit delta [Corynebacterium sp. ES2730-CONJ]
MKPVHLILGDEDFLIERTIKEISAAIKSHAPTGTTIDITQIRAGDITKAELLDLLSPSLFGEDRIVVIDRMDEAGKEPAQLIVELARDPGPGIYVIISHSGGGRQKALVTPLKKLAEVHEIEAPKQHQRTQWLNQEFRRLGVQVTPDVLQVLLEGVGSDLRALSSAVDQLVADTDGEVTAGKVRQYYEGVAEVSGFDVADLACQGDTFKALASMRRALQLGVEPAALATALSMKVSGIARLYSSQPHPSLAGQLGMHPYVLEKTAQLARRWRGDNISQAVIIAAELDAEVKGQGGDPAFALEQAVRQISQLAG